MASEATISDLTLATTINDNDNMLIEDAVSSKRITPEKIAEYVTSKLSTRLSEIDQISSRLSTIEGYLPSNVSTTNLLATSSGITAVSNSVNSLESTVNSLSDTVNGINIYEDILTLTSKTPAEAIPLIQSAIDSKNYDNYEGLRVKIAAYVDGVPTVLYGNNCGLQSYADCKMFSSTAHCATSQWKDSNGPTYIRIAMLNMTSNLLGCLEFALGSNGFTSKTWTDITNAIDWRVFI